MSLKTRVLPLLLTVLLVALPMTALAAGCAANCPCDACNAAAGSAATPWNGTADVSWYDSAATELTITTAEQLAGMSQLSNNGTTFQGQTIRLGADIDLADKTFLPIYLFEGTFDGGNHTIYNMNMDMSMHSDGVGRYLALFRTVRNATVKNVDIDGASIQTCCGGIDEHFICEKAFIAGMAEGTCVIENIRIMNSFAETYNNSVAGVVSELLSGGDLTMRNVQVDASNTLSALWDTYDARVAGMLAYMEANTSVTFENCFSSPVLDVHNDAAANYQYYLYRLSGMLIGQIVNSSNSTVTVKDTTVAFGDWNQYTYCEFQELGQGSYNGPEEWKCCRTDSNSTLCYPGHTHREFESHEILLPFTNLIGASTGGTPVYAMDGVTVLNADEQTSNAHYFVIVENGGGGGLYIEGSSITVTANEYECCAFSKWEVLEGDSTQVASLTSATTTVNVTDQIRLKAMYVPKAEPKPEPTANVPKTGDNSPLALFAGLMVLSAAGMLFLRKRSFR